MSEIEKEIKKIREDLKEIKSDLKTFMTDETSKNYVQALIDNVNKGNKSVGDYLEKPTSLERFLEKPKYEIDRYKEEISKEYLEQWTCDICGEHTHEVEYDYIGSNFNHLGCELKEEINIKHEIAAMEAGVDVKREKN